MSVNEMLTRIDSHELTEWMAYYTVEPFGENRADLRAGIISSTIANINRSKDRPAYKPLDFMPYAEKEKRQSLTDGLKAAFKRFKRNG